MSVGVNEVLELVADIANQNSESVKKLTETIKQ